MIQCLPQETRNISNKPDFTPQRTEKKKEQMRVKVNRKKEINGFLILPYLTRSKEISLKHESSSKKNKIFYGR